MIDQHQTSKELVPVALTRCHSYADPRFAELVDLVLTTLTSGNWFHGHTILVKPNLISSRGPALACSSPQVLTAVCRWFVERGGRVAVGDSPAFGSVRGVMVRHGLLAGIEALGCGIVNFRSPAKRQLSNGLEVTVAAEALECDLLVNLPRVKAHSQLYLTAAVKNLFGVIVGYRKAMLHMHHGGSHHQFADLIVRLPEVLPPLCSIVDGVVSMHRTGPLDGDALSLGLLGGCNSAVALDTALLSALELPFAMSPLWLAARDLGRPGTSLEELLFPLAHPEEFHGAGFLAPGQLNPVRFHPWRLAKGGLRRLVLAIRQ